MAYIALKLFEASVGAPERVSRVADQNIDQVLVV